VLDPPLVPVLPLDVPLLVPLLVPVPLDDPALFPPLDEEPARFAPLDGVALLPLLDDPAVPEVPLLDEPALFAPEVPELVPLLVLELRSELDPLRVRLVSLLLLLGCVVGSLLVVPELFVRLRVFVPVSVLS
jgi:hypothetical protein